MTGDSRSNPRPKSATDATDESGRLASDRALSTAVRVLALVCLVGGVAIGAAVYGPELVESIDSAAGEPEGPGEDATPTPDPALQDPDDPGETVYDGSVATVSSADVEAEIHELVNERRAEEGLDPLERDWTVASVSRAHSVDMHERDFFAHESPDGEEPLDRFQDVGEYCQGYGENIATTWVDREVERSDGDVVEYNTAEELAAGFVDQWLESPPHREAMLSDEWDRGGVGVYLTDEGEAFATHNFCKEW